jgi:Arc/MetJ-type ribon-helix-helix transcriptional regulator
MSQVQLRLPEETVKQLDAWVAEGRFKSRSDAIRTILNLYEECEKNRRFYEMLQQAAKKQKSTPKRSYL